MKAEFEVVQSAKNQLESELGTTRASIKADKEKYRTKLDRLEKELESVKSYRDRQHSVEENKKQLALDLEKERGKYTGNLF